MVVAEEKFFKIRGDDSKKAIVQAIFKQRGMKDREGFGRLIDWFCAQDEIVQAAVLGSIPAKAIDLLEDRILAGLKAANSDDVEVVERGRRPNAAESPEPDPPSAKRDTPPVRKPAKRGR